MATRKRRGHGVQFPCPRAKACSQVSESLVPLSPVPKPTAPSSGFLDVNCLSSELPTLLFCPGFPLHHQGNLQGLYGPSNQQGSRPRLDMASARMSAVWFLLGYEIPVFPQATSGVHAFLCGDAHNGCACWLDSSKGNHKPEANHEIPLFSHIPIEKCQPPKGCSHPSALFGLLARAGNRARSRLEEAEGHLHGTQQVPQIHHVLRRAPKGLPAIRFPLSNPAAPRRAGFDSRGRGSESKQRREFGQCPENRLSLCVL